MSFPDDREPPTPDARREQEARSRAAEQYRLDHHDGYREHTAERAAAAAVGWEEAERLYPGIGEIRKAHRHARLHLRKWDKANPNPLTWDEYERLEAAFAAVNSSSET